MLQTNVFGYAKRVRRINLCLHNSNLDNFECRRSENVLIEGFTNSVCSESFPLKLWTFSSGIFLMFAICLRKKKNWAPDLIWNFPNYNYKVCSLKVSASTNPKKISSATRLLQKLAVNLANDNLNCSAYKSFKSSCKNVFLPNLIMLDII